MPSRDGGPPGVTAGGGPHVAVVGAGAFGGWAALHLLRAGCRVTLVDAWGPGNSRASSGGESRVLRHTYAQREYVELVRRALELWLEHEARWQLPLFRRTGVLWLVPDDDAYERAALPLVRAAGVEIEELSCAEVARRWPLISLFGIHRALFEPGSGALWARAACARVAEALQHEGGTLRSAQVQPQPGDLANGHMAALHLAEGGTLEADRYLFACGPWLGRLFPEVVSVQPTRQEVFFFGPPAGDTRYDALPTWADHGDPFWYGIPGGERRGFKLADDTRGPPFDPTDGDRTVSASGLDRARAYLARRFPGLAGAPLLESRVCQYEQSLDGHPLLGRHPAADNVWLLGGGSGHGFKLGPALGELAAAVVLEHAEVPPLFQLERFA